MLEWPLAVQFWKVLWLDWQWVVDVNMWGVIHGLRVFVPAMLAQDTEPHC